MMRKAATPGCNAIAGRRYERYLGFLLEAAETGTAPSHSYAGVSPSSAE